MLLNVDLVHFLEDLLGNKMNVECIQLNEVVDHKKSSINLDLVLENKPVQKYLLTNRQDRRYVLDIPLKKKILR